MVFNSIAFFIFLPIVVLGFYLLPQRLRWVWLLLSGFVFYGWWKWQYLGLLLLSGCTDFFVARRIANSTAEQKRKRWLWLSIAVNIGILILFKYVGAFAMYVPNMEHYMDTLPKLIELIRFLNMAPPDGVLLDTFQSMRYPHTV